MKFFKIIFIIYISLCKAQIGDLIWEENFNNLDNWMKITGNGSWGWGNGELEYYLEDNVDVAFIPDEPGNNALHIMARIESGPNITDQWGNPLNYTSGKVTTKAKVSIKYGMIESRVRVPDIDNGGWPAVWLLGTANYTWPRNGEMDMMEMGSRQAFRDLHDQHNGGNGANNSNVNQVVGANAIFYSDAAINPDNPSGAASISWDPDDDYCRPYYNYNNPFNGRFLIYRTYWDEESIRFTVVDDDVEYDLYTEPFPIDSESDEFHNPFYLVANLAIGGLYTDTDYLGGSGLPISMPFPSDMYVDYIKVYEWNQQGEVNIGPPNAQSGTFGIFTDNTTTSNSLEAGVNSEIYVWEGTLMDGTIAPYEGTNGITWASTGLGWFGAGIMSMQPVNLSNFEDGFLKFMIKIPANISFQIGIIDAWGNQSYVEFPENQTTYGLVRDGDWGQASIPVSEIRGEFIDLRMLSYEFVILEVNGASCEFAIDDIYWDGGHNPCVDVVCEDGETCEDGDCVIDPCYNILCENGYECYDGECIDIPTDPCEDIICGEGQTCDDGDCIDISENPQVTFLVDMQNELVDETGVYVSGADPQLAGPSGILMSDQGNGIWSLTISVLPGTYTYKFRNGFYDYWDGPGWESDLPSECGYGQYNDRQFTFSNTELILGPYYFGLCELSELDDILGDINTDGEVNVLDIVFIIGMILGDTHNQDSADINQDGLINILDILELVNIVIS